MNYLLNLPFSSALSKNERGVSLLELALLLPVVVLLVAGLVDFGFKVNSVKQVNDAARHAARITASHARRVLQQTGNRALCSLPDDPFAPVAGICSQKTEQPISLGDSIAETAFKSGCNAIITAGLNPEQWQVTAAVQNKKEDNIPFLSIRVDISRIGQDCIICYENIFQGFVAKGTSEFVLEEPCAE